MTTTLSAILMEIVQKAMEVRSWTDEPMSMVTETTYTVDQETGANSTYGEFSAPVSTDSSLPQGSTTWSANGSINMIKNNTSVDDAIGGNRVSYWSLVLLLIPTCTLFGNLLVIISVVKCRSLHSPINYFILGLAIADMCVAMAVMPFAVYVEFNADWELGTLLCDLYCAADVTCSTASIFLLTVISFDRYVAATQPIRYANSAKGIGRVAAINLAVWLVSMLIASPMVLGLNNVPERDESKCMFYNADFIIYSSTGSFCIPLVIIVYLYGRIYCVIRERSKFAQQRRQLLGAAARYSVSADKSVVICPPGGMPTTVAHVVGNGNGAKETAEVKHTLLAPMTTALGDSLSRDADGRRPSGNTIREPTRPAIAPESHSHSCVVSSTGSKSGHKTFGKLAVRSSTFSSKNGGSSSRVSKDITRSPSVTSSSSSASSTTKEDSEMCVYTPHIDLIRHLQKTSHALASRHRQQGQGGKRKPFHFPGACNSFLRNVSGVASSNVQRKENAVGFSLRFGKRSSAFCGITENDSKAVRSETASSARTDGTSPRYLSLPSSSLQPQAKSTDGSSGNAATDSDASSNHPSSNVHCVSAHECITRTQAQPLSNLSHGRNRACSAIATTTLGESAFQSGQFTQSMDEDSCTAISLACPVGSSVIHNPSVVRNYDTFTPLHLRETTLSSTMEGPSVEKQVEFATLDEEMCDVFENAHVVSNDCAMEDTNSKGKMNGAMCYQQEKPSSPPSTSTSTGQKGAQGAIYNSAGPKAVPSMTYSGDNSRWYTRLYDTLWSWCPRRRRGVNTGRASNSVDRSKAQPSHTASGRKQPSARKQNKGKKVNKSHRKEKKATKTLAIVLGIFLICWLPFFTLNLLNAVCIKLKYQACQVGFLPFFLTTWLGYMNSLMNPIIYTIFNLDFRRAFKQILCPCWTKHRARRV